jgi:hypothetical protein
MQKPAICGASGVGRQMPPEPHEGACAPLVGVHALTTIDHGDGVVAVTADAVHASPVGVDGPTSK